MLIFEQNRHQSVKTAGRYENAMDPIFFVKHGQIIVDLGVEEFFVVSIVQFLVTTGLHNFFVISPPLSVSLSLLQTDWKSIAPSGFLQKVDHMLAI